MLAMGAQARAEVEAAAAVPVVPATRSAQYVTPAGGPAQNTAAAPRAGTAVEPVRKTRTERPGSENEEADASRDTASESGRTDDAPVAKKKRPASRKPQAEPRVPAPVVRRTSAPTPAQTEPEPTTAPGVLLPVPTDDPTHGSSGGSR